MNILDTKLGKITLMKIIISFVIEVLKACPQDAPVWVAYDSLVCIYELRPSQMVVAAKSEDYEAGVYLCAMRSEEIGWHINSGDLRGKLLGTESE